MTPEIATRNQVALLTAIIVGIIIVSAALIAIFGITKVPEEFSKITLALIQSGSLIRIATALVIVAAIIGLRVLDKVSAEGAIAALSSIAGYVLGGVRSGNQPEPQTKSAALQSTPPQSE